MTVALMPSLLDPEHLISTAGFVGLLLVIFAEGGLLFGMFFPGDSLLFTAGLLLADGRYLKEPLWVACLSLWAAAVLGNQVGYLIGRKAGPAVFSRPNSRVFKQAYVDRTTEFLERYGGRAILLARFVPIVRTLITFMAGACRMNIKVYTIYSIIGGGLWAAGVTALGYRLGTVDFVRDHIELIMIGVVVASFLPIVFHLRKERRKAATGLGPAAEAEIKKSL